MRDNHSERWSLASLLAPVSVECFADNHWGRAPLHVERETSDFYDGLISLAQLERYFSTGELFERHTVEAVSQRWGAGEGPPRNLGEISDRLLDGDSLRLRRMECLLDPSAPIVVLTREMESALQHPLNSLSCYISPPDAGGLGPHYDETEIFTLQIEGTKRWQLFHRVESTEPAMVDRSDLGAPSSELTMFPGDLLYLPHGWVHDVESDEASFSITIVFDSFRWSAVLDALADRVRRVAPLIDTMPIGVALGGDTQPGIRDQLNRCLAVIRNELDTFDERALTDTLASRLLHRMSMPPGHPIGDMVRLDRITPGTLVRRRADVSCHLVRRADCIEILLPGAQVIQAPSRAEPAIRAIIACEAPFRIADIRPSPGPDAQISLVRTLVGAGLLELMDVQDG